MLETTDIIKRMASDPKVANKDLAAIGIGAFCSDLHKVRDMVENKFKVATFAGNEALCAAFGEKMLNPNAGVENLLYMHSDIGCGIMVRGETYFSADNDIGGIEPSGEQISEDEIDSLLERSRYLKPWGGDFGMVYAARREIEKGVGTKIVALSGGRTEKISEDIVVEAALEKDDLAMSIVQTTAMSLGTRIAYLVNLFAAEAVIVGGAIRRAEEQLLGPIKNIVRKLAFKKYSDRVKIMTGALGKDAVSLGAASLAAREVFLSA
jgi:predicted NBD/HSP70 family sugar kinase